MLLDSNIIIYSTQPEFGSLRTLICDHAPSVSIISYIEVLGYHKLTDQEHCLLEQFFDVAEVISLSDAIAKVAVDLRKQRRMSLGDSIIAATAVIHRKALVTHNTADFDWIKELAILDPLA